MGESARWHDGRFWCSDWVAGDVLTMAVAGDERRPARRRHPLHVVPVLLRLDRRRHDARHRRSRTRTARGRRNARRPRRPVAVLGVRMERGRRARARRGLRQRHQLRHDGRRRDELRAGLDDRAHRRGHPRWRHPSRCRHRSPSPTAWRSRPTAAPCSSPSPSPSRLAAFDIDDDFSLSNRRVWAEIEGGADGVSLDAEGALWCAARGGASLLERGRPRPPAHRARPSGVLGGPRWPARDDVVHGRQRMERPREHRQRPPHRGRLHDRGRGPRRRVFVERSTGVTARPPGRVTLGDLDAPGAGSVGRSPRARDGRAVPA